LPFVLVHAAAFAGLVEQGRRMSGQAAWDFAVADDTPG